MRVVLACWTLRRAAGCWLSILIVLFLGLCLLQAGDASGTGLLDVAARHWDPRLTAMIDDKLLACLPRIIGPDEVG
jgi:sugar (pentulose or hexulose) kinase